MDIARSANQARAASIQMAAVKSKTKNRALSGIIESLIKHTSAIESANGTDMKRAQAENLAGPLLKRLRFDEGKIVIDGGANSSEIESLLGYKNNDEVIHRDNLVFTSQLNGNG